MYFLGFLLPHTLESYHCIFLPHTCTQTASHPRILYFIEWSSQFFFFLVLFKKISSLVLALKVRNFLEWIIFWKWTFLEMNICTAGLFLQEFFLIHMKETRHLLHLVPSFSLWGLHTCIVEFQAEQKKLINVLTFSWTSILNCKNILMITCLLFRIYEN